MVLTANAAFTERHRLRTTQLADPPAGNDANYTVPVNEVIQVVSIRLALTSAAAAADRRIEVTHFDALGFWPMPAAVSPIVQRANLVWYYRFACGFAPLDATGDANDVYGPLCCGLQLYEQEQLRFHCNNLALADQISGIYIRYYHWKED